MNNELQHYGIKGQKWGVRRFQNKDGSLTAAGKQKYGSKENFDKQYPEDVKKSMHKAKSRLNTVSGAVDKVKDFNAKQVKKAQEEQIKKDVYNMSDQELQRIVNRLNMEERYKQVMNSRAAEVGKNNTAKVLEYAGTALAVGVGAIDLMLRIREMQK